MLIENNVLDALDDLRRQGKTYSLITADPPDWNEPVLVTRKERSKDPIEREQIWQEWCNEWIQKSREILKPEGAIYMLARSYQMDTLLPRYPEHATLDWQLSDPVEYEREHYKPSKKEKKRNEEEYQRFGIPANLRYTQAKFMCLWNQGPPIQMPDCETNNADHRNGYKVQMSMSPATYYCQDCNELGHATLSYKHRNCLRTHSIYSRKPSALYHKIFQNHAKQRRLENVLVLFAGSGTEMVVARELGYPCDGIEICPDSRFYIRSRLSVPEFENRLQKIDMLERIQDLQKDIAVYA